jgi:hypothetical protein
VKAYLITTGTLFALLAAWHLLLAIDEAPRIHAAPWYFLHTVALALLAAALSIWAWRLLRHARPS